MIEQKEISGQPPEMPERQPEAQGEKPALTHENVLDLAGQRMSDIQREVGGLDVREDKQSGQVEDLGGSGAELGEKTAEIDKAIQEVSAGARQKIYEWIKLEETNFDKDKFYRIVDEAGYRDFLERDAVRSSPTGAKGDSRPTAFPSFSKGEPDLNTYAEKGADNFVFEAQGPLYKRGDKNPVTGKEIKGRHAAYRPIDEITGETRAQMGAEEINNIYKVGSKGDIFLRGDKTDENSEK
jgi:hypothetical protein